MSDFLLRNADDLDLAAITAIYAHYVIHTTSSFEEVPPDVPEIARRRAQICARGLPYLVAEQDGAVLGYAYADLYRPRSAYRFTLENSIYVAPGAMRRGVGRALLGALLEACAALGYEQMVAVLGGADNVASLKLHENFGFAEVGHLRGVGFKFGAWVDSVLLQRRLQP